MQSNSKKYVIGIGELYCEQRKNRVRMGGIPADFAYACSLCGYHGGVVSALGCDESATYIARQLDACQLENFCVENNQNPTGRVEIYPFVFGGFTYRYQFRSAWRYLPPVDHLAAIAQATAIVGWSSLPLEYPDAWLSIKDFVQRTHESHTYRAFRLSKHNEIGCSPSVLHESLHLCNVLQMDEITRKDLFKTLCIPFLEEVPSLAYQILADLFHIPYILYNTPTESQVYHDGVLSTLATDFATENGSPFMYIAEDASFLAFFVAHLSHGSDVRTAQQSAFHSVCHHAQYTPYFIDKLSLLHH